MVSGAPTVGFQFDKATFVNGLHTPALNSAREHVGSVWGSAARPGGTSTRIRFSVSSGLRLPPTLRGRLQNR